MSEINTLADGLNLSAVQLVQLEQNLNSLRSANLLELASDVARAKEGARITRAGLDLLAKAVAGKELQYTRAAFGDSIRDGLIVEPTDKEIVEFTGLINEREINLPFVDVRFSGGGTATVKFQVQNHNLENGFWAREIGLFARDPDTGEEILYCYKNNGVLSSYIPGGGGAVSLNLVMSLVTVVDQATNITAIVNADLLLVRTCLH